MIKRWKNATGSLGIEIEKHYNEWVDITYENDLPELLIEELKKYTGDYAEIVIYFSSTGYYDSGSMYGGVDHLGWPPEGEDERVLRYVEIYDLNGNAIKISSKLQDQLFSQYETQIYKQDVADDV